MIAAFTAIDWIVLLIVVVSVIWAVMKGFVREIVGLGSLLLAFLLASWFYVPVAAPLKDVVKTENLALFCGFSIVFVGTLIAGLLVAWIVTEFLKAAKLRWFDRCLGALFGLLRGWLLGGVVFMGLTTFNIQTASVRDSELAPYFLPASRMIALVAPSEFKERFLSSYTAIEQWWKEHH